MLFETFLQQLQSAGLQPSTSRLLLAVSGGIDSMVMLHLFSRTSYRVAVAHCNFRLRGEASDADERLVSETAAAYGMPLHVKHFDTEAYAAEKKISIQMAARELRYVWFEQLCRDHAYTQVAVAHHGDDDIETFFINLGRGTGIRGLSGMASVTSARIVRPLLATDRPSIEAYAFQHDVTYREDASNASDKYIRNRIRHHLIPVMQEIFPQYREGMRHSMHLLADASAVFHRYVQIVTDQYVRTDHDRITVDLSFWTKEPAPRTLLYELLRPYGFSSGQAASVANMVQTESQSGRACCSDAWRLLVERGCLLLVPRQDDGDETYLVTSDMQRLEYPLTWRMDRVDIKDFRLSRSSRVAQLDADKVTFPLTLRHWRKGDWFCPLGMHGRQKLSDFWINNKTSLPDKKAQWLLCSGPDILWIPGHRMDDRFKVTPATRSVWIITLDK